MWDLNAMNFDIFQWYAHKAETPLNLFSRGPVCFTWATPLSCFKPFSINSAYSTKESPPLSDLLLDVERHLVRWWRWDRANEKCERSYEQMLKWFECSSGRWRTLICRLSLSAVWCLHQAAVLLDKWHSWQAHTHAASFPHGEAICGKCPFYSLFVVTEVLFVWASPW